MQLLCFSFPAITPSYFSPYLSLQTNFVSFLMEMCLQQRYTYKQQSAVLLTSVLQRKTWICVWHHIFAILSCQIQNSPLSGCYLADARHHLLLNLVISIIFSNPDFGKKYLLISISPVFDKDAFTQKPERLTSKLSKNLLTKCKRKHFQKTEFYFYDKENFIRASPLAGWLGHREAHST